MIRYLGENERSYIRPLYAEVFDDPLPFLDYYFHIYLKEGTRCLVEEADGQIVSMISIHEKTWMVRKDIEAGEYQECPAWYLYAIATKEGYRHQGRMRRLMERVIADGRTSGIAYIYLIPVNPAVYDRLGFRLVVKGESTGRQRCDAVSLNLSTGEQQCNSTDAKLCLRALADIESHKADLHGIRSGCGTESADIYERIAQLYAQSYRQAGVDVFLKKDARYFMEQGKRARIEGGDIYLLSAGETLLSVVTGTLENDIFTVAEYMSAAGKRKGLWEFSDLTEIAHLLGARQWKAETFPVMVYEDNEIRTCAVGQNAEQPFLKFGQMDEV